MRVASAEQQLPPASPRSVAFCRLPAAQEAQGEGAVGDERDPEFAAEAEQAAFLCAPGKQAELHLVAGQRDASGRQGGMGQVSGRTRGVGKCTMYGSRRRRPRRAKLARSARSSAPGPNRQGMGKNLLTIRGATWAPPEDRARKDPMTFSELPEPFLRGKNCRFLEVLL